VDAAAENNMQIIQSMNHQSDRGAGDRICL